LPAFQIHPIYPSPFANLWRNLAQWSYSSDKLHSFTAELSGVEFANDCFLSAVTGALSAKSDWGFARPMSPRDS
jgi:hypothetical protein